MDESKPPQRNPKVTPEQLALVRVNEEVSKESQQALRNLVYEYRDIFVFNNELGCLNITYSKDHSFINVKPGYTQLYQRPYPVTFHERQKTQEEIDKLI
jgi:hypothetical protein